MMFRGKAGGWRRRREGSHRHTRRDPEFRPVPSDRLSANPRSAGGCAAGEPAIGRRPTGWRRILDLLQLLRTVVLWFGSARYELQAQSEHDGAGRSINPGLV